MLFGAYTVRGRIPVRAGRDRPAPRARSSSFVWSELGRCDIRPATARHEGADMTSTIEVDYLVIGARATGMAFTDSVLAASDATVAIVDRRDRPGGHWVDAYPFVRLHQPANFYGISSEALGTGAVDTAGFNAGFYELASGPEVVAYYDRVMRHRFLPSGRVRYLALSEVDANGRVVSLLNGDRVDVDARCVVDGTYSQMQIPSTHPPSYDVAKEATCVPVNALPRRAADYDEYVVVGAGKTGMDACCWLLEHGVDVNNVRWIMPRDAWVLNRANFQPGEENFARFCKSLADQAESVANATSIDDLFARLEACDELRRIDPKVTPRAYHCAILSDAELGQLRRIPGIVRMGRVRSIDADHIVLDEGSIATSPRTLHVDCSASGIPTRPTQPIFEDGRITLQFVRWCQPTFSAALIGHVAVTHDGSIAEKNSLLRPIPAPDAPIDWLRTYLVNSANLSAWNAYPEIERWRTVSRLDPIQHLIASRAGVDAPATEELGRFLAHLQAAADNGRRLLAHAMADATPLAAEDLATR